MKKFLAGFAVACTIEYAETLIAYLTEWAKSAISVRIAQNNSKLPHQEDMETQTRVIGFAVPSNEEEDYDGE